MGFALPIYADASLEPPDAIPSVERVSPRSVRISVTDRCDMACVYCRPSMNEGYLPAEDRLDVDQWERLVRGLMASGVRRVRITGGEPLLFRDIVEVVSRIAALGIDDLAMTTNASQLAKVAGKLRDAGLQRLNISIDSLDSERFARMTRGGDLREVLRGIDAAAACGFDDIKTNTVVIRDENEGEVEAITQWAWARGITPRFLEVMGVGEGAKIFRTRLVPYGEIQDRIAHLLEPATPRVDDDRGPARYLRSRDRKHRVGFITGTSDTFCAGCDRLRVTSDGMMRACLSKNDGVDISATLGPAAPPNDLGAALDEAWAMKPDSAWRGCTEPTAADVSMRGTGG